MFCATAHGVSTHTARCSRFYRLTAYIAQLDLSHLEHIDNSGGEDDINAEDEGDDSDEEVDDKSAFGRLVLPKGHKNHKRMVRSRRARAKLGEMLIAHKGDGKRIQKLLPYGNPR